MTQDSIRLYGATWCPDTSRARRILNARNILFTWYDVDVDMAARAYVKSLNDGDCRIPTIVFADGSILIEPEDEELESKLTQAKS